MRFWKNLRAFFSENLHASRLVTHPHRLPSISQMEKIVHNEYHLFSQVFTVLPTMLFKTMRFEVSPFR
jgi:hypothetical protein